MLCIRAASFNEAGQQPMFALSSGGSFFRAGGFC
jgi:hypothetical protein